MPNSLYICYFGVREPLVQTQVIPYLVEIMKTEGEPGGRGVGELKVSLLTFEPAIEKGSKRDGEIGRSGVGENVGRGERESGRKKERDAEFAAIRERLAEKGIDWHWLPYHKWPSALATAYDVFRGALFIRRMISRQQIDVLHGRVHIPTLMGALARKLSRRKPKLLFDIRGFFPEEYTDAGVWPEGGWLYRSAKRVERWLLKEADGFVVLTEKAREILFPNAISQPEGGWLAPSFGGETPADPKSQIPNPKSSLRPVEVIPCCVDFESRFTEDNLQLRSRTRKRLRIENRYVITHVGALGGLYLTDDMADFLAAAKSVIPETFALFLTQVSPDKLVLRLEERGFSKSDYFVGKVPSDDVPAYLSASDVGLSFVRAGYATQSRSPTKIAEYLGCGLPIVANRGVGDVDRLILESEVGVLLDNLGQGAYQRALDNLKNLGDIKQKCRITAVREFDLSEIGGTRYRRLYKRLLDHGRQ